MSQPIVLVTFYSRCGSTEHLALSAAVGAVQARGLIRMRRLPDAADRGALDASPECREAAARMRKEYVAPAEADVLAAHALVVGAPAGATTTSAEWEPFLSLLARLGAEGKLAGKVGAAIDAGDPTTFAAFSERLREIGFTAPAVPPGEAATTDPLERAVALGRRAVATVAT